MSDPSHNHPSSSSTPIESLEDDASETRSTPLLLALVLGLFKLAAVGMVVYLTYFFTTTFAHRTPPSTPLSDEQIALAKKGEDLRAQGKKVLSSYGWVDPVTKSKLRIPIDRAMELYLAESNRPAAPPAPVAGPTAPPAAPAGKPGIGTTKGTEIVAAPAPPPVPSGMAPEQIYRLVCMACHDTDGRGKLVKLAMPAIPDLTDAKWQASRTDAELTHSILEGKESTVNGVKVPLMLPMKDKLALAHTDVKDMVAFMRAFKGGKQIVSATPSGPTSVPAGLAPVEVIARPMPPTATQPASTTRPAPFPPAGPASTEVVATRVRPTTPSPASPPLAAPALAPTPGPGAVGGTALPPALPVASMNRAARAEKLRVAGSTFNTLCIACHGPDGRGTTVRVAMPAIPDFTSRDFQTSRTSSQLATSILEGKGTLMIPWNTRLTADQARDLALYVRNFGPADLAEAESGAGVAAAPSLAEFDNKLRSLRQQFDDLEKQLKSIPGTTVRE